MKLKPCCKNAEVSSPAGGLTIFDNTGLVVPELDADGLPPPGTRLRKGMALYVTLYILFELIFSYIFSAGTGLWILCPGWRASRLSSMQRRPL